MNKIETLKIFLKNNFDYLYDITESWDPIELPKFDITHRDYLDFASRELQFNDSPNQINAISNIKRAIESSIDLWLTVIGLYSEFKKRNAGLHAKLVFIEKLQIIDTRTLTRINKLRNTVEHEYSDPKLKMEEIENYYTLASSIVYNMESLCQMIKFGSHQWFKIERKKKASTEILGDFEIIYMPYKKEIKVIWKLYLKPIIDRGSIYGNNSSDVFKEEMEITVEFDYKNNEEFMYFFKVFIVLWMKEIAINNRYAKKICSIE